jgi:hypothetical protein
VLAALCAAWLLWTNVDDGRRVPEIEPVADQRLTRIQVLEALIQGGRESVPELIRMGCDPDPTARRGGGCAIDLR